MKRINLTHLRNAAIVLAFALLAGYTVYYFSIHPNL